MASSRRMPGLWAVSEDNPAAAVWPRGRCQSGVPSAMGQTYGEMRLAWLPAGWACQHLPMIGAAVSCREVSCWYPADGRRAAAADTVALDSVDLEVAAGQFVSIVGPSGSGKSTLLRVVTGLRRPDAGRVEVLGTTPEAAAEAKRIGFAPQSPALLPWATVAANVALPLQVNRRPGGEGRDPRDLLARVGLADAVDRRPGELSGGMAQRVAIARALVTDPELLVMDEPFAALDELTRESLRDVLLGLWDPARTTVLWVTHSVAEAVYLSDRVVVLSAHPGRVVADVPVDLPRPRRAELLHDRAWTAAEDAVREALRAGWQEARG